MTTDIIDLLAGISPGDALDAVRSAERGRGRGDVEGLRLAVDGDGDDGVGLAQRF